MAWPLLCSTRAALTVPDSLMISRTCTSPSRPWAMACAG
jgi:hypothetical protein